LRTSWTPRVRADWIAGRIKPEEMARAELIWNSLAVMLILAAFSNLDIRGLYQNDLKVYFV
jgi:hypothetical protein